ncbi:MAG: cyclopropane-fatty-acyl-phospholipid synthase family protein [Alteromonadaceae bacterium]|uniref:cyclopropane-fatty-acyl-phospholipid synthase family protein n=1 Tax=Marinobacter sp. TaxID=50741 RepID=UPI0029C21A09|nr:cyclopropane-fatty-acyl-phospholipid synthase family protein [Marinobacter sp.]MDX5385737.1 cyclopropane-fatty-acyl-phospholipid synthase family protein [Marinobacter sp.]MDX5440908.1 cyclopropane-fatty-acyl-phospholipid synthase family protein [Alteromonadaceae bacterium]MDX5471339.1 cyclopropane-fatty-acyl-phospholipid synthase family protein [Marinobacter sp.]
MAQGTAPKTDYSDKNTKAHVLSLPLEGSQIDREPHNYERWLIAKLMRMAGSPPIRFRLWNGDVVEPEQGPARFTLHLKDHKALYSLVANPNLAFGDLYSAGRLEIDGDLPDLMESLYRSVHAARQKWPRWLDALWRNHTPRSTGISEAKENIHHHYDLGNEFYQLWLDQAEMQYTCAYYESANKTLEQAQLAKLEHVCRKLRLKPGMTVVEAGCGWGGLARYMARNYGVKVHSYNISREQLAYAQAESERQGLDGLITYVEDDYRNITGQYDAFVSVGMLEHVGKENYRALSELIKRSLKPNGIALLHSIGRNRPMLMNAWIEKRIFPGAYPPSIGEFMEICEQGDFSVLDVENLRLHYAQTLSHWMDNFTANQDKVTEMYDEHFTRAWRLYLAGSIAAFRAGSLQLFQVVFTHGDNNQLPRSRQDLYTFPATPEGI